ncbi:MAG TPA: tripartite tricarboxylate transporter substrate binding protein [Burkholderiales bacterium]|nr:tripartite tricarboxylate transporter substrate binding protein [Burkholderiales bacterium]
MKTVLALLLCVSLNAYAQSFPSKPVRLIVPFPPGGAVDYYARAVQPRLAEALGQPILIENRSGAGGMVGADMVAKSAPDGYTLLVGNIASLAINVGIYSKMTYDPRKDLTPILRTVAVNYVMAVHPSVPAKSVAEFVAHAKANPGKLAYGSAGSGSAPHLATELLKQRAGIDILHVPFKGGGPMVADLLGGQIHMVIADQANLMPHVKAGKLRALAVGTTERSPAHPEIPTLAESGFPGFEARAWQGIAGPAGMSAEVVRQLNGAFIKAMAAPDVRQRLIDGGLDPIVGTPEEFAAFIRSEIDKWSKVAKDVGAKAE